MSKKYLPEWIIAARGELLRRGMSQSDLADAIGYSRTMVTLCLNGHYKSRPMIIAICGHLGVDVDTSAL